jgi:IS5 family transposase
MKADGLLGKNWLKGAKGDALHALLCSAGHNLRMILRHLRVRYLALVACITMAACAVIDSVSTTPSPAAG